MHQIKIATCCYCGARTALRPTAREGHELACASCGAPLHEMKWLKAPAEQRAEKAPPKSASMRRDAPPYGRFATGDRPRKKHKRPKKRRRILSKILEEGWDVLEDIFD